MSQLPINGELVGLDLGSIPVQWDEREVMLYALAVGAKPAGELDFIYEGRGPKVLPGYGVIPGTAPFLSLIQRVAIDLRTLLHGEQAITWHRPIPPSAKATSTAQVTEVWDKGSAAVLVVEAVTADDDGPLFTNRATLFLRGAGGFGGERGPAAAPDPLPERAPDAVVTAETGPAQAALYRLLGDPNPIHIDPDFARMAGFERPFLHGLCTFGIVCRTVLSDRCDGDPAGLGTFGARFADQVYPGDEIVTKIWETGPGRVAFQSERADGTIVLSQGRATTR
ncbi:MAG: MaoC/PaaZ C-terminal domain-containing protein [Actinomycetota bacterium]